jgi:hypothetical protein
VIHITGYDLQRLVNYSTCGMHNRIDLQRLVNYATCDMHDRIVRLFLFEVKILLTPTIHSQWRILKCV